MPLPLAPIDPFAAFVDYCTLCYHEARHVRFLVKKDDSISPAKFTQLVHGLAADRYLAWKQIQPARAKARAGSSAAGAEQAFARRYGVTLSELSEVFRNPNWKHSAIGGNRWATITDKVLRLKDSVDGGSPEASSLAEAISKIKHNTGRTVHFKIQELDKAIA